LNNNKFSHYVLCLISKKSKSLLLCLTFVISSPGAYAADFFGEIGLHLGGDDAAISVNDSVMSGGFLSLSGGLVSPVGESLQVRTSLGYKIDVSESIIPVVDIFEGLFGSSDNSDDLVFERYPLELMFLTNNKKGFNFGIGLSYHLSPEISTSNTLVNSVKFDDALGFVAEIDFKLGERGYVGLKYTSIDYESDNPNLGTLSGMANFTNVDTINGDSFGVVIGIAF